MDWSAGHDEFLLGVLSRNTYYPLGGGGGFLSWVFFYHMYLLGKGLTWRGFAFISQVLREQCCLWVRVLCHWILATACTEAAGGA